MQNNERGFPLIFTITVIEVDIMNEAAWYQRVLWTAHWKPAESVDLFLACYLPFDRMDLVFVFLPFILFNFRKTSQGKRLILKDTDCASLKVIWVKTPQQDKKQ